MNFSRNTKFWIDSYFKVLTRNIFFIEAVYRFRTLKRYEFEHIRYLHDRKGGHWIEYLTSLTTPNRHFTAIDNSSIPVIHRTSFDIIDGHYIYKNLFYQNPNGGFLVNGIRYSRKPNHFIINPSWGEDKLIEEMAYAWINKRIVSNYNVMTKINGINTTVLETKFKSKFSSGVKVDIIFKSNGVNIYGDVVNDYISLFTISLHQ